MANDIATYFKYANLQMAAEALLNNGIGIGKRAELIAELKAGNNHSSKFTQAQATEFTDPRVKGQVSRFPLFEIQFTVD